MARKYTIVTYVAPNPELLLMEDTDPLNTLSFMFADDVLMNISGRALGSGILVDMSEEEPSRVIEYGPQFNVFLVSDYEELIREYFAKFTLPEPLSGRIKVTPGRFDIHCAGGDCVAIQPQEEEYEPSVDIPPGHTALLYYVPESLALPIAAGRPVPLNEILMLEISNNPDKLIIGVKKDERAIITVPTGEEDVAFMVSGRTTVLISDARVGLDLVEEFVGEPGYLFAGAATFKLSDLRYGCACRLRSSGIGTMFI